VITLTVIVFAIWSPTRIERALVPSCARTMVNVVPTMAVTRMISALAFVGDADAGQTVQLKGAAGNVAADATSKDVPVVAGDGATATVEYARFAWLSKATHHLTILSLRDAAWFGL
jgi:hypothetical protein